MILKKVIIDNKEVFEPIDFNAALVYENKKALVFTDEDEQDTFLDRLEEIEEEIEEQAEIIREEAEEEAEQAEEEAERAYEKTREQNHQDITFDLKDLGNVFNKIFRSNSTSSKTKKLLKTIPFMSKEDVHEIVENILDNKEEYKEINLVTMMPFISKEDADKLFMKLVDDNDPESRNSIIGMAPFISKECLTYLVDEYVKGNYQELKMDALYPFMDSADVKKVFTYIISKKD